MLTIIEYGKDQYEFPALIVLGCFDAIHAGHKELLKKAKLQAKINGLDLGVMMFKDGKGGKLLYSFEERVALLEEFNVKFVLAIDYNDEFKKIAPLAFLAEIEDKINVKAYMSGKDFRFGAGAKGKASTLKNYADDDENGVWYMNVKDVDMDGEKISTTLIKSCLDDGNVEKAAKLLGRPYSLTGEVVKGEGRGTSLVGYPTVNMVNPDWKYPVKTGVYNVTCNIDGVDYNGVANFGNCPTFDDDRIALETYIEGFSGDLYGRVLTINFISYLRDIEKFSSAEELANQLAVDVASADQNEETIVEEVQPETVEETIVEEVQPETIEETVIEEIQPEIVEETVAEETQPETIEETMIEETQSEVVEETVIEEIQPEIVEEVVAEETQPETIEETIVEEVQPETIEETVIEETQSEVVEETVVEETIVEEIQPETVEEVLVEEIQSETIEETVIEEVQSEETEEDGGKND